MQFSVIVPLYNKSQSISRALKSIIAQSYKELEVIVVDDGSTDNGVKVVENFKDPRIRLVRQKNYGVSAARNKGISIANHPLIAFLDADDAWMPWFLETIAELIRCFPEAYWYATNYEKKSKEHTVAGLKGLVDGFVGKVDDFFALAVDELPVHISSVVIRRTIMDRVGMFPVDVKYGEDQDLFCRLALHTPLIYNAKICATYFLDAENRACDRIIIPEIWPFLKEYSSYLNGVDADTANSIKEFIARRFITRAKSLKDIGKSEEARQAIAVAESTKMLCKRCQKVSRYCNIPMPLIRIMIRYKYYKSRAGGLWRRFF